MQGERFADRVPGPVPRLRPQAKARSCAPRLIGGAVQESVWLVQAVTRLGNRKAYRVGGRPGPSNMVNVGAYSANRRETVRRAMRKLIQRWLIDSRTSQSAT